MQDTYYIFNIHLLELHEMNNIVHTYQLLNDTKWFGVPPASVDRQPVPRRTQETPDV